MGSSTRKQRFRNPFVDIEGAVYVMVDWFDLQSGRQRNHRLVLERLTAAELAIFDRHRNSDECAAAVLALMRRRLSRGRR